MRRLQSICVLLSLSLAAGPAAAQTATFVKDIRPGIRPSGSGPRDFATVGTTTYFRALLSGRGFELWKTDGTGAGTVLVKDIRPGSSSSNPRFMTGMGSRVYFAAGDGTNGTELWTSDGTARGTVLVKDIEPGSGSSSPSEFVAMGGTLYFRATTTANGAELWKSDGTPQGTVLVKDIEPGKDGSDPAQLIAAGSTLFFAAFTTQKGLELWKSDGTPQGTVLVKDIRPGQGWSMSRTARMAAIGGIVFFRALDGTTATDHGAELWRSDGTEQGTVMVRDIVSCSGSSLGSAEPELTAMGKHVYFRATDGSVSPAHGKELWRSDGTPQGTLLVKDILPGVGGSSPRMLVAAGSLVYFAAHTRANGVELWVSDGTEQGTRLLRDICPGVADGVTARLGHENRPKIAALGSSVLFSADDGKTGTELWTSAGTAATTVMLADIAPGAANGIDPFAARMHAAGSRVLLAADDGTTGRELWRSDGTATGTVLVKNLQADGAHGSGASDFVDFAGSVFFRADDGKSGAELWKSDGTASGTKLFKDIAKGPLASHPAGLTMSRTLLFFGARDLASGRELWKSDGTATSTVLVRDLRPGAPSSSPDQLTDFAGVLYFSADDGTSGRELWKSDGSAQGTVLVKDIEPGAKGSDPRGLVLVGNTLWFTAFQSTTGREIWKSDGTTSGTVLVRNIRPRSGSGLSEVHRNAIVPLGSTVFFVADDGSSGSELWKSDGSASGTVLVADIRQGPLGGVHPGLAQLTAAGTRLYFAADDGTAGREVWSSDGTALGTRLTKDIRPGASSSEPSWLRALGPRLLFRADDGSLGRELFSSDGTAPGTRIVKDLWPGAPGSSPEGLTVVGSGRSAWFRAYDPTRGNELFKTDGSAAGTVLVTDIREGPGSSFLVSPALAGTDLWFSASDGTTGHEPWRVFVGGTTTSLGQGCGKRPRLPLLRATDPVLGRTMALSVLGAFTGRGSVGVFAMSHGPEKPLALGSGCFFYVDLTRPSFVLPFLVDTLGGWKQGIPIPAVAGLATARFTGQSAFLPTDGPLRLDLTNGLRFVLGN